MNWTKEEGQLLFTRRFNLGWFEKGFIGWCCVVTQFSFDWDWEPKRVKGELHLMRNVRDWYFANGPFQLGIDFLEHSHIDWSAHAVSTWNNRTDTSSTLLWMVAVPRIGSKWNCQVAIKRYMCLKVAGDGELHRTLRSECASVWMCVYVDLIIKIRVMYKCIVCGIN